MNLTFCCPQVQGVRELYDLICLRLENPGKYGPLMPVSAGADTAAAERRIGDADGADFILQTSGSTTGHGHLVGLTAGAFSSSEAATAKRFGGRGRWLLALPAHHVAGFQVLACSCAGGTFPILPPPGRSFRERKVASFAPEAGFASLVPTQLSDLLEGEDDLAPLRSLRAILVGGAASSPALLDRARQAGLPVVTTYGMTETAGGCVYDGLPLDGVHIRISDGRICLSGPMLAQGYLDDPRSPAFTFEQGRRWHITSDAGAFTDYLQVFGRLDDAIISGGVKVFARQVEDLLREFPGVRDVAVLPVADPRWGQAVGAVVEADFAVATQAEAMRKHVRSELGKAAPPRLFVQGKIPMLASGKLDRKRATALLAHPTWAK